MLAGEGPEKTTGVTTPIIVATAGLVGLVVAVLAALVPSTMREATLDTVRRSAIDTAEQVRATHERYVVRVQDIWDVGLFPALMDLRYSAGVAPPRASCGL